MRFQLFKMFESRTSELSEAEFRKILHEKCKDFVKAPKLLQRSKTSEGPIFSYINPKIYTREPMNSDLIVGVSSRHHTLLMDNLPSWSKFPKRSQSVIGLTSADQRIIFGSHRYLIIPFDGANFGVAPSSDLWACRVDITDQRPMMEDPNFGFDDRFSQFMKKNSISDNSYGEMITDLQNLYNNYHKIKLFKKDNFSDYTFKKTTINLFKKFKEKGVKNVEDGFNHFFSPDRFRGTDLDDLEGFHVMNWSYLTNLDRWHSYEFWTDSECSLYYIGKTENPSWIEEAYDSFISDFIINK